VSKTSPPLEGARVFPSKYIRPGCTHFTLRGVALDLPKSALWCPPVCNKNSFAP
jgi:hypothetical protein